MANGHQQSHDSSFGVLVGWSHHGFNGRLDLCLQRVPAAGGQPGDEVEEHHFVMTDNQARVLANYLNQVLGARQGRSRPAGLLGRLFRA